MSASLQLKIPAGPEMEKASKRQEQGQLRVRQFSNLASAFFRLDKNDRTKTR